MKIRRATKINKEDFAKDNQALASKLAEYLNIFNDDVYRIFDSKISVTDNLDQEYIKLSCRTDGLGNLDKEYPIKLKVAPTGLVSIYVKTTKGSDPTSQPFPMWTLKNNILTITKMLGLSANSSYDITLLVLGA